MKIRVLTIIVFGAVIGVGQFASKADASDEYLRVIEELLDNHRTTHIILNDRYERVGVIKTRQDQFVRKHYVKPRPEIKSNVYTPLKLKRGVSTFKERRSNGFRRDKN